MPDPIQRPARISIDLDDLPYTGEVLDQLHSGGYQLTGLTPGTTYLGTVRGLEVPVTFHVLQNPCLANGATELEGRLAFTADDVTYDFAIISESAEPVAFELQVVVADTQAEGTVSAPVMLTPDALPYSAAAPCATSNRYAITGLDPGKTWLVSLASADRSSLRVVDSTFATLDCDDQSSLLREARCQVVAPDSTLYFAVDAFPLEGAPFTFDIDEVAYVTEGTPEEPLELALDDFPHTGSVSRNEESHYLVTGLSPGAAYDVSVLDATDDVVLQVMIEDTDQGCAAATVTPLLSPLSCTARPIDSTARIEVWANQNSGTHYSLSIVPR